MSASTKTYSLLSFLFDPVLITAKGRADGLIDIVSCVSVRDSLSSLSTIPANAAFFCSDEFAAEHERMTKILNREIILIAKRDPQEIFSHYYAAMRRKAGDEQAVQFFNVPDLVQATKRGWPPDLAYSARLPLETREDRLLYALGLLFFVIAFYPPSVFEAAPDYSGLNDMSARVWRAWHEKEKQEKRDEKDPHSWIASAC